MAAPRAARARRAALNRPQPPHPTPRAPTFKWAITIANVADFQRPPETISTGQQCAVTATGVVWSRFSTQITPVNYNLLSVNAAMACTGAYQLWRKWQAGKGKEKEGGGAAVAAA
jgi:lysozyme family protein